MRGFGKFGISSEVNSNSFVLFLQKTPVLVWMCVYALYMCVHMYGKGKERER